MDSSIADLPVIVLDAEADMDGLEAELLADTRLNFSRDEAAALCTTLYVSLVFGASLSLVVESLCSSYRFQPYMYTAQSYNETPPPRCASTRIH